MAIQPTPNIPAGLVDYGMVNPYPTTSTTSGGALPTTQNYVTPPNIGGPAPNTGSSGSLFQGSPLPNVTTSQTQATAAPQFYTDYLNNLATQGKSAAENAQFVGATPLQQQAFDTVSKNVGNYQPALTSAINLANSVGGSNLAEAIGNLGHQNIAYNLAPQATAGIVGAGQFGSSRGATALGEVMSAADLGITEQQQKALQQDMVNKLNASQTLGNLAGQTQQLGLGDINALSTLGGQQQSILQNEQLFPMQKLANESAILRGYAMPTSTSSTYTGPMPGAYSPAPLSTIGATLLGAGQFSNTPLGSKLSDYLFGKPASGNNPAVEGQLTKFFNSFTKNPTSTPTPSPAPIYDASPQVAVQHVSPELDPNAYVNSDNPLQSNNGVVVDQNGQPI